jgi:endogenous inhibitor of DNA gyrase (YacG/DUF329 family)
MFSHTNPPRFSSLSLGPLYLPYVLVPNTIAEPCPAAQKCCSNACTLPFSPTCSNPCNLLPDKSTTCLSATTYAVCLNNQIATLPATCPVGTACCGGACVSTGDFGCAGFVPPSSDNSNGNPQPTATTTATASSAAQPTPGTGIDDACLNVKDNDMACQSSSTFGFCSDGSKFVTLKKWLILKDQIH